ncbi:hypothetical protein [Candidatus Pantoea floridensis]|uniref:Uncharacterized protein n=1 Tax=Candidatus Pantoea floridensis TaxID=1938870 RepID=A0A286DSA8_9GAMM|nr:hypothetical protein [Pantoea floridensis]PIF06851.1 hypothetical protein BX596_5149 [Enterobacteriaceae bacterium JKS000233]SOD61503.1 hypothetical protein SAMN06273570_5168 [Pantoea floridensis]
MKYHKSNTSTKISEQVIALCYTLAVSGIYFISRFTNEDIVRMKSDSGEIAAKLYALFGVILMPIITLFAGYTAIYLTFRFIRQITEKGGK